MSKDFICHRVLTVIYAGRLLDSMANIIQGEVSGDLF